MLFYLVYTSLEQLENENQGLFDWMCLKLDNGRWWFRRDYERLAAKYKEISLEERNTRAYMMSCKAKEVLPKA